MPPSSPSLNRQQTADVNHQLLEHNKVQKSSAGPLIGAFIIIVLLIFGALYFWGAYLNSKDSVDEIPFIPSNDSTQETG